MLLAVNVYKIAGWVANSVDPDIVNGQQEHNWDSRRFDWFNENS